MRATWSVYHRVDLDTGACDGFSIPDAWYETYLGGRGVAARLLAASILGGQAVTDLPLVFATGPLQGTGAPGAGKHVLMGYSPKTGAVGDSYVGGYFGHNLARSGMDGLIIQGASAAPCYLLMLKGRTELREAGELWGMSVDECTALLKARHGRNASVCCIGPAGERGVRFANVMHDEGHAAGRLGFGQVMGNRKLKAIVVQGGSSKPLEDPSKFRNELRGLAQWMSDDPGLAGLRKHGTPIMVEVLDESGMLPTRNFREGSFERAADIGANALAAMMRTGSETCAGCPVRCRPMVRLESVENGRRPIPGPEYETIAVFGSLCAVSDLAAIAEANWKCNRYGLDTISTGVLLSYLMEASENGLLKGEDVLSWGDAEGMLKTIDRIVTGEGLGEILRRGVQEVARELGGEEYAVQVKGVEVPMHDPRTKKGLGISYATSPRGASHLEGFHDTTLASERAYVPELSACGPVDPQAWEEKARFAKGFEEVYSFCNSLIICGFVSANRAAAGPDSPFAAIRRLVNAATGLNVDVDGMLAIGERGIALRKLLAAAAGYSRSDDGIHPRFSEPLKTGACQGACVEALELEKAIDEYYRLREYDDLGPTPGLLRRLDMEDVRGLREIGEAATLPQRDRSEGEE